MTPRATAIGLSLLVLLPGCTRAKQFMNFLREKKPAADAGLPKLAQADAIARLQALDLSLGGTDSGVPLGSFFLCQDEKRLRDDLRAKGGVVAADVEVDAAACGGGLGAFTFRIDCPGEPDGAPAGVASHQLFHRQGFNFGGPLESRCVEAGKGRTRFRLLATLTQPHVKTRYSIDDGKGEPCSVARAGDGAVTIEDCVYETRTEEQGAVVVRAAAKGMKGLPGQRYYGEGSMEVSVNDWVGAIRFTDGTKAPVAQLANGKDTITVRMAGAYTAPGSP